MCDEAYAASTVKRKVSTLIEGDYGEHPDYWNNELNSGHKRLLTSDDLYWLGATGDALNLAEEPGTV